MHPAHQKIRRENEKGEKERGTARLLISKLGGEKTRNEGREGDEEEKRQGTR